jgi:uncharacterized protein with von Willebrand factor type A (vWA) domain
LNKLDKKYTTVIIFSDAGTAKSIGVSSIEVEMQEQRVTSTISFLQYLKRFTSKMIWLNPMPKIRWSSEATTYIRLFIKMIETNNKAIEQLIEMIKRKH